MLQVDCREHGSLIAAGSSDATAPPGWATIHVPALPVSNVQFFRVVASEGAGGTERECVVIYGPGGSLADEAAGGIAEAARCSFPGAAIAIVLSDSLGAAEVYDAGAPAEVVAAAVAEAKRAGGWDESQAMSIDVGTRRALVELEGARPARARVEWQAVEQPDAPDEAGLRREPRR